MIQPMIQRKSCPVGQYGSLDFLGRMRDVGSFIFTLDREQKLPYEHLKHALDDFTSDWILFGLNEHHNLVFVVKASMESAEKNELFLQKNLAIIAGNLAEKLSSIGPQIMLAKQMADTEQRLPIPIC